MNADRLFLVFIRGMFIIIILFGAGTVIVIMIGDQVIGLRMVNAFASMFVGMLGFGSGYLLARRNQEADSNGKEDA